jgi:hypothetical protein
MLPGSHPEPRSVRGANVCRRTGGAEHEHHVRARRAAGPHADGAGTVSSAAGHWIRRCA